jgi:2-keto-3-deoxy-L-rhamnonate aldolase RhmA
MNTPTLQLGTWLSSGSPAIAELAALGGFDWLLLDLKHGSEPEATFPGQLRGLGGHSIKPIVRAAYYAPRGRRGLSRTVRTHGYGLTFSTDADAAPRLMMQIESVEGVKHVDSIAAVDGVDVLFVGPADLRHDLEHHAQWNVDVFDECLATVVKAAQRHQKPAGILCRGIESIKTFADQGFTEIAVDSDLSIVRQAYQQIQAAARVNS